MIGSFLLLDLGGSSIPTLSDRQQNNWDISGRQKEIRQPTPDSDNPSDELPSVQYHGNSNGNDGRDEVSSP